MNIKIKIKNKKNVDMNDDTADIYSFPQKTKRFKMGIQNYIS
jgi:hypothetical protein